MDRKEIYVTRSSMPDYEEYCRAIKPLWETRILTNMGEYHQKLEGALAEYLDVPQVSLLANGHMSLELTIQAFDFPEGGEVITTPFTFVSTTHAIIRNRLTPVFCDVMETDGTIDPQKIENLITNKTVAIIPVHVYGNVCDVEAIQKIADKYGLKVIYDAAHAFGVRYKGVGIGNYGDASIFSFHATKVFHTVEGGAVVCKSPQMYERLYYLKNFGIQDEETVISIGANAKLNEFSSIMGLLNLAGIDKAIDNRKKASNLYAEKLGNINEIRIVHSSSDKKNLTDYNYAFMPILFYGRNSNLRDYVHDELMKEGIYTRKYFCPLTIDQKCFKHEYGIADVPVARALSSNVLALPLYDGLENEIIEFIYNKLMLLMGR